MINELKNIADMVSNLLVNDTFPNQVEPQYLQDAMRYYPSAKGKRLRPALLIWSCGLFNGDIEKCSFFATAVEIWHNWTLVHDDIIDQDSFRRGNLSTHMKIAKDSQDLFNNLDLQTANNHGVNFAILCGDLQQNWAIDLILKGQKNTQIDFNLAIEILQKLQHHGAIKLISGEAIDVELAIRDIEHIKYDEVLKMMDLKTSALFRAACEIGAALALGNFSDERIKLISDFATNLGIAFQIQDDLLGVFGLYDKFGKNIGSDIRERKPTLLLLKSLELANPIDKKTLLSIIGDKELTSENLEIVKNIMQKSGAYDIIFDEAIKYTNLAKLALLKIPKNHYRDLLEELLNYLTKRDV